MKNFSASENQIMRRILFIACAAALVVAFKVPLAAQGNKNGAAGQMPSYYDGELFTINIKQLSDVAFRRDNREQRERQPYLRFERFGR